MNIYFSGIGGVGIGPLAEIAHDTGYTIYGSDQQASLMTTQLEQKGMTIHIGQDGSFLKNVHAANPINWFVHTAALPHNHPELVIARELGIKTAKRDELLAHIISEKHLKLIAVAGTHGKTTTTGMLIWAFKQSGIPVSYSVGTTISYGPSGQYSPDSEYFIYECDEFDRNFLHFSPYLSIITSIDYDHPDTYPTEQEYKAAFRQFIEQSRHTIMWDSDGDYIDNKATAATVLPNNAVLPLKLPGAHNRRNATLVLEALASLSIGSKTKNQSIIESFPGTDRRFEQLANNLYSDYGHHPVEITATLQLAKECANNVVLVYQPHQNIRQHEIKDQYTDAVFHNASEVYWLPTYLSREDPKLSVLTPDQLSKGLSNIHIADLDDELWRNIQQARQDGKLVIAMGAGSIDEWLRKQLATN